MIDIVLASNNSGKLAEMREMLNEESYNLKTPVEFGLSSPEETGKTFVENSIIKARHASLHTGLPSIADDSGLCVPALNCEPGIFRQVCISFIKISRSNTLYYRAWSVF